MSALVNRHTKRRLKSQWTPVPERIHEALRAEGFTDFAAHHCRADEDVPGTFVRMTEGEFAGRWAHCYFDMHDYSWGRGPFYAVRNVHPEKGYLL